MASPAVDQWLLDAARRQVSNFATELRSVSDPATQVPNLEWTVAELGQHVAGLPWHFQDLHEAGPNFERPNNWAAWSDTRRAHVTTEDVNDLATLIVDGFDALFADLADGDNPRWFYGAQTSPATIASMSLNEAVMHGRDLAAVTGSTPPMLNTREAHAVAEATALNTSVFIDPDKAAAQPDGVYHVKFRGGKSFTFAKAGPDLIVTEGKPPRADAHLSADPAMFMLASMGRIGQVRAALSGKMFSYGRKPWRLLGLEKMVADGV